MPPPDFDYDLPSDLIAQSPVSPRDHSRLMIINRLTDRLEHHYFYELPLLLHPDDVLVFNQTKVIPARLYGTKATGGKVEVLLLRNVGKNIWDVISRPGLHPGQNISFSPEISAHVLTPDRLQLNTSNPKILSAIGHTPLPPYIHSHARESVLRRQYQTVYAKSPGSAAAPTAGFHFTRRLLNTLHKRNIQMEYLTLHVGLGTFKPPTQEQIATGQLHHEYYELPADVASRLNQAKTAGRRIIAVGTTTTRVLETCAGNNGLLIPKSGDTNIFIKPPYKFKFVDGLITNFHLPKSSLIMLVSAFSSWKIVKNAYTAAVAEKYRFYSFGDATFIA